MIFTPKGKINFRTIFRLLGMLLLIEAAFMCVPLATSCLYQEPEATRTFLYAIAITLATGTALTFLISAKNNDMGKREGFLLTALTWIVFSLFGTLPFVFGDGHTQLTFTEGFFETMSGFTTTGVSTIRDVEATSHGLLMWRAIMHFIGGMGIILFTLAVIPMLNKQGGIQLFNAEVTGITHDKVRPRISHTAKSLWAVYIVLNVCLIALLWIGPMNLFDAICHAFSTIATGGFSTKNASIAAYDSFYVKLIITVFMFLSGINFGLLFKAAGGDIRSWLKNDTFRGYCVIILIGYATISLTLLFAGQYSSFAELLIDPLFQVVSAITTTGFSGADFNHWHGAAILCLTSIMFIGSCAGSTSGGAKVDRIVMVFKNLKNEVYKILHPNTITPVRVNGKVLSYELSSKIIAFLLFYLMFILIGTFILASTGLEIYDAFFAVVSCISNNGLGYGFTGASFADISPFGKWILSAEMLIGRLEIFTIVVLFTRTFWNKE